MNQVSCFFCLVKNAFRVLATGHGVAFENCDRICLLKDREGSFYVC